MEERIKNYYKGYMGFMLLMVMFLFFKSTFNGFLGWEIFLVSLYKQAISILFPYMTIRMLNLKNNIITVLIFFLYFWFLDTFVIIELDFFVSFWEHIFLAFALIFLAVAVFLTNTLIKNFDNEDYSYKKIKRLVIMHITTSILEFICIYYLLGVKYGHIPSISTW